MGRRDEITLSPKHGVNPSLEVCFICGEETGSVLLPGLLDKDDSEAPRHMMTGNVCDRCKKVMEEGVFFIEVDPARTTDPKRPYRTGRIIAVKDQAIRDTFDEEAAEIAIKQRIAYMDIETFSVVMPDDSDV